MEIVRSKKEGKNSCSVNKLHCCKSPSSCTNYWRGEKVKAKSQDVQYNVCGPDDSKLGDLDPVECVSSGMRFVTRT